MNTTVTVVPEALLSRFVCAQKTGWGELVGDGNNGQKVHCIHLRTRETSSTRDIAEGVEVKCQLGGGSMLTT